MRTYTSKELETILHLTEKQAAALLRTEGFPSTKIGRTWLVTESALERWLEETDEITLDYKKI